jgi:O-antigen ligase
MQNRHETALITGLALLLATSILLFVPLLANAFAVKTHIVVLGILALAIIGVAGRQPMTLRRPGGAAAAGLVLLLLAASLSALLAQHAELAARAWVEVMALALLVTGIYNLTRLDTAQRRLESALILAAGGVALFALKQFFLPALLDPGFHALGKMRVYSTLGNSNLAALAILPAIPLAVFRALSAQRLRRWLYAGTSCALLAGLLVTQSRHAVLALAVMLLVGLVWLLPPVARRITLAAVLLGAVILCALLWWVDLPPALLHSIKGRWFIWSTAAEMLWQHPWAGVGPGHFALMHPDYQTQLFASGAFDAYFDNAARIQEAHNQFLHWGATAGGLGLLGFALLCATLLWQGWRSPALRAHAPQWYLALVGYLVAMLFVAILAYTVIALIFWLVLALVWRHIDAVPHYRSAPAVVRPVAMLGLAVLLASAGVWALRDLRAGYHEARGDMRMEERDLWNAAREYQRGRAICPTCSDLGKKYATTLYLSGQLGPALQELRALRATSGDVALRILEGEVLTRLNRLDEAEAVYRQIIANFPKMVGPRFILAQVYALQGKHAQAEQEFRQVLDIEPSPYNLNLTSDKVELQKDIARQYLRDRGSAAVAP